MTNRSLHYELTTSDNRRRLIKRLYIENRFFEVINLLLNKLM